MSLSRLEIKFSGQWVSRSRAKDLWYIYIYIYTYIYIHTHTHTHTSCIWTNTSTHRCFRTGVVEHKMTHSNPSGNTWGQSHSNHLPLHTCAVPSSVQTFSCPGLWRLPPCAWIGQSDLDICLKINEIQSFGFKHTWYTHAHLQPSILPAH